MCNQVEAPKVTRNWVFFTSDLDGGGSQKVLVNLANGFAARGQQVELVAMRADGVLRSSIDQRVRLTNLHSTYLTIIPNLIRYLRTHKPDTVIGFYNAFTLFLLVAQRLSGTSVCIVPTIHVKVTGVLTYSPVKMLRLAYRLALPLWRRSPMLIAVSQAVAHDLITLGIPSDRIRVLYNPILTADFLKRSETPLADDAIRLLKRDTYIILGVGRLDYQKNFAALIRAHANVQKTFPSMLVLLGDGPERQKLQRLAESLGSVKNVLFLGYIPNPLPYMRCATVLVLSSRYEGLPTVAVEALAVGTSVVGYEGLGLEEIRASDRIYLVRKNDEGALTEGLIGALSRSQPDVSKRAQVPRLLEMQFGEEHVLTAYDEAVPGR